jgi:hypothetical protein
VSALTGCEHRYDGRLIPCPQVCPVQQWPVQMFRLTWLGFGSRWKLRRSARRALKAVGTR